jgi:uncharacterized protein YajQ (UPF0234 family)
VIKIKQGLESNVAKDVSAFIRDLKLKVTVQIQGDELRVTGKESRRSAERDCRGSGA